MLQFVTSPLAISMIVTMGQMKAVVDAEPYEDGGANGFRHPKVILKEVQQTSG